VEEAVADRRKRRLASIRAQSVRQNISAETRPLVALVSGADRPRIPNLAPGPDAVRDLTAMSAKWEKRTLQGREFANTRFVAENITSHVLVLQLVLEFCQKACGDAGPFQMQANLVERVVRRAGLRTPVQTGHDSIIGIPQKEFCVDLRLLDVN
jgi:hypothetical protein